MRRKIRTLIADDDAIILRGMRKFIDWEQYGFEIVDTVSNGKDLLEVCRNKTIDLVITDIEMPKLNGLDVMKELRKENKHLKIIVISGYDKFEYAKLAISYGVYYYLLKPINPVELVGVLNRLREELSEIKEKDESIKRETTDITQVVQEIKKRIDDNDDADLSIEYIQENYFVSSSYFSKAFKDMVGVNYSTYRLNHKMRYAAYLLEHTNYRMYEIAEKLHYDDERYFGRVFKKYYGKTPKEWRNEKR